MRINLRILAIATLAVAAIVVYLVVRKHEVKVWLVNGLDVPVQVNASGTKRTVPPHGHLAVTVKIRHKVWFVAYNAQGTEIDRQTIAPEDDGGDVVYNVLGAAQLSASGVMYSVSGFSIDGPKLKTQTLPRVSLLQRADIDFYFDAPYQIPKPDQVGPIEKHVLHVSGPWQTTLGAIGTDGGELDVALAFAKALQVADPDNRDVIAAVQALDEMKNPPPTKSPNDWVISVPGARLSQETMDDGSCLVRCELPTGLLWDYRGCIATTADRRTVSPDCIVVSVVHPDGTRTRFDYGAGALSEAPRGR